MGAIFDHAAHQWRLMKSEFDAALEAHYMAAETETNGNLLSHAARDAGRSSWGLFRGSRERAESNASEELMEYWQHHPCPTLANFEASYMDAHFGW